MNSVTPIRPRPVSEAIEKHIEATREVIFDAIALTDVAAAASVAESPANEHSFERALWVVSKMLNRANELLDSATLGRVALQEGDNSSEGAPNG